MYCQMPISAGLGRGNRGNLDENHAHNVWEVALGVCQIPHLIPSLPLWGVVGHDINRHIIRIPNYLTL